MAMERESTPFCETPYLSLNDLLNLAVQLRSEPELTDYLAARRSLPPADLRLIGDEETLFSLYLLNDGTRIHVQGCSVSRPGGRLTQARVEAGQRLFGGLPVTKVHHCTFFLSTEIERPKEVLTSGQGSPQRLCHGRFRLGRACRPHPGWSCRFCPFPNDYRVRCETEAIRKRTRRFEND